MQSCQGVVSLIIVLCGRSCRWMRGEYRSTSGKLRADLWDRRSRSGARGHGRPLEPVSKDGKRYVVPRALANAFAVHMGLNDAQNFPRAVDPAHEAHHFAKGWQGVYHVRFLEKVSANGDVEGWEVVWGQPKHNMRAYFNSVSERWPELKGISFDETFCRALAGKRKLRGFKVVCSSAFSRPGWQPSLHTKRKRRSRQRERLHVTNRSTRAPYVIL